MANMLDALNRLDARVNQSIKNVAANADVKGAGAQFADQLTAQKKVDELLALASVALAALRIPKVVGEKVDTIV